jgi:hypothetical protein
MGVVEVATVEDLEKLRLRLLSDIKSMVSVQPPKKWLKTQDVMEMLGMSEVTLQTLRNNGVIPFKKLGGICYYNADELDKALKNL